jgi:2'-5' RNA ligase
MGEREGGRVRSFVAVELPAGQRTALGSYLEACARRACSYRWVPAENLHLTLRFLGHLEPAVLDQVREGLTGIRMPRFRIALGGLGSFGPKRAPRVVWIGVAEGAEDCAALAAQVEEVCLAVGLEPDRPFAAHLTLARSQSRATLPELPPPPRLEAWTVDAFTLFRSQLNQPRLGGGRSSRYLPLARFTLT